ncbi:hypothetical protein T08_3081, partial [Trichinella sp. T8]
MENLRFERRIKITGMRGENVLFYLDIYSTNTVFPPLRGSSNRRIFLQRVLTIHNMMRQYVIRNIENMNPNEIPPSYVLTLAESLPVRIGLANQINQRLPTDVRQRSLVRRRQHQNRMDNHNHNHNHNEARATARIRGREDRTPPMRECYKFLNVNTSVFASANCETNVGLYQQKSEAYFHVPERCTLFQKLKLADDSLCNV